MSDTELISVITATHDPEAPYLQTAYQSLINQEDVRWEWLIQFDGESWDVPHWIRNDSRIRVEINGAKFGIANTRNLALARAKGAYVQSLDSDDWLLPDALSRLSSVLRDDPDLGYAVGQLQFLVNDALTDRSDHDQQSEPLPSVGKIMPQALYDFWEAEQDLHSAFNFPMWRRDVLLAYGGWAAISTGEDFNVLFAVSEDYPGELLDDCTLVYRQHADSVMHNSEYWRISPRNRAFTVARIEAIRALRASSPR